MALYESKWSFLMIPLIKAGAIEIEEAEEIYLKHLKIMMGVPNHIPFSTLKGILPGETILSRLDRRVN